MTVTDIQNKLSSAGIGSIKFRFSLAQLCSAETQPSWDWLKEAQLSNSVLTQISLAQKGQLREDQLLNSILTLISFAQKSLDSHHVPKSR